MAAASISRQMPTKLAAEDYSAYGHMSDEELIQLAIERSLADAYSSSQPACSTSAQTQSESAQSEGAARAQADMHTPNVPTHANPVNASSECQSEESGSKHVFSRDREMILAFRRRKQSLDTVNPEDDKSFFNSAICNNDTETVRKFMGRIESRYLNKPNSDGWIHLHEAAYAGSLDCLIVLITAFPDLINERTHKNQTPLMFAVARKHLSCAKFLIAVGGDPNIANRLGETALYKACEKDNEEMVELLLKSGGHASKGNAKGVTPLHEAVGNRNFSMCKLLLEAGAKILAKNAYGIDPLFTAAQIGATELLTLFLRHGGDVDTQANDGATAVYEASKNGHEEVVKLLVSRRADINKTTKAGLTPLHVASKNGHVGIVLLLLPRTSRALVERSGISPLHLAAERNRDAILKILIEAGFYVNTPLSPSFSKMYEDHRTTALYFTVRSSNIDAASMLLEAGADPNLDVFNPLLVAVRKGNLDMVSLLIEYGANMNACMPTHPTTFPGAFLFCMRHRRMFKLLLDYGCDVKACFTCVYGNGTHPPVKIRRPTRGDLYPSGLQGPHTETAQFCEVMADPSHSPWTGPIIDLLLDYVGHVNLCSRLIELLDRNKDWEYIKEKSRPPLSLMHLCRLRIRQLVGQKRLRQMTSLPLPGRIIKYLLYDNEDPVDFKCCDFD